MAYTMKRRLGRLESQFLAYVQMRNLRKVRRGELQDALGLSETQERDLLSRLERGGLIARVVPGVYLVPDRLPLGGSWSPGPAAVLNALMEERGGRYQVCGPTAFNRYGYVDQVPVRVFAYNNRISGDRTIGSVQLSLIKVSDDRLGATSTFTDPEGVEFVFPSRTRCLVDGVYDWSRFNSLPAAYGWIRQDLASGKVEVQDLVDATLRFGNVGTVRRVGAVLDRLDMSEEVLQPLDDALPETTGWIPVDPTRPKRGPGESRWGVVWNERGE